MGSTSYDREKEYKCNNFSLTISIHKLIYINFVNHVKSCINEGLSLPHFLVSITILKDIEYATII